MVNWVGAESTHSMASCLGGTLCGQYSSSTHPCGHASFPTPSPFSTTHSVPQRPFSHVIAICTGGRGVCMCVCVHVLYMCVYVCLYVCRLDMLVKHFAFQKTPMNPQQCLLSTPPPEAPHCTHAPRHTTANNTSHCQ